MLLLEHIFKTYYVGDEAVHALDDASLHVKPKEFVAICGPSGSGKTTLMNVMGCLDLPDSGRYILDGVNRQGALADSKRKDRVCFSAI